MGAENAIVQLKRLTKLSEGIERRIAAEKRLRSKIFRTIAYLERFLHGTEQERILDREENEIRDLLIEVSACERRISKLEQQIEENKMVYLYLLLCLSLSPEILETSPCGEAPASFDWDVILSERQC